MAIGSLVFNVASSLIGGVAERQRASDVNKANALQYQYNTNVVQEVLTTLGSRVSTAELELNRNSIRTQLAAKRAMVSAKGEAEVRAAALGAGGVSTERAISRGAERITADVISDAMLDEATGMLTLTQEFNDRATQAVDNLNNSRPLSVSGPSFMESLLQAGNVAVSTYSKFSDADKDDILTLFD